MPCIKLSLSRPVLRPQPRPPLQVLGHFTLYDYNSPLDVPDVLHGAFDVVVADPPYLVCPLASLLHSACQNFRARISWTWRQHNTQVNSIECIMVYGLTALN